MEKISGFSLVRNGVKFEYPFLESWRSILPLVDELVLNIGKSEDSTLQVAQKFSMDEGQGKVKIIETEWPLNNPEKKKSGLILSEQTNIALDACKNDWCFYIQADEVIHEDDYPAIRSSLEQAVKMNIENKNVDALVFQYQHFYGSYNVVQNTRSSYRREMRMVKKSSGARSVGDAQSFKKFTATCPEGVKLDAILTSARIFHYGWVKTPEAMKEKTFFMDQLYHGDRECNESKGEQERTTQTGNNFKYKRFWGLSEFSGTHPAVMQDRIKKQGWIWNLHASPFIFTLPDLKKVFLDVYEKISGHRPFEFKNYKVK